MRLLGSNRILIRSLGTLASSFLFWFYFSPNIERYLKQLNILLHSSWHLVPIKNYVQRYRTAKRTQIRKLQNFQATNFRTITQAPKSVTKILHKFLNMPTFFFFLPYLNIRFFPGLGLKKPSAPVWFEFIIKLTSLSFCFVFCLRVSPLRHPTPLNMQLLTTTSYKISRYITWTCQHTDWRYGYK